MKNCFCGIGDRRKVFSHISSRHHCYEFSPWETTDIPRSGFESAQNLNSDTKTGKEHPQMRQSIQEWTK